MKRTLRSAGIIYNVHASEPCIRIYHFYSGEALVVTTSDVVLSKISNDANKRATFIMYVYIKESTALLNRKILQVRYIYIFRVLENTGFKKPRVLGCSISSTARCY